MRVLSRVNTVIKKDFMPVFLFGQPAYSLRLPSSYLLPGKIFSKRFILFYSESFNELFFYSKLLSLQPHFYLRHNYVGVSKENLTDKFLFELSRISILARCLKF